MRMLNLVDSNQLLKENLQNYGEYAPMVETGHINVKAANFTEENIDRHIDSILNIFRDGIDLEKVHSMYVNVEFVDGIDCDLMIEDYIFQLIFWKMPVSIHEPLTSETLFFSDSTTVGYISKWVYRIFIKKFIRNIKASGKVMKIETRMMMNNIINESFEDFKKLKQFQPYLNNTLCLEDTLDFMNKYEEFNETMHMHFAEQGVPLEDMVSKGMEITNIQKKYITAEDSEHCLKYFFISKEGIADKQYKEVAVHVGPKPNGMGGIIPSAIDNSYLNGGLNTVEYYVVDASASRVAQMLSHENVGRSGDFARILQLNNTDTKLHNDNRCKCNTKHLQEVYIKDRQTLMIYDMRYYRFHKLNDPKGLLESDKVIDADTDTFLIGRTIYIYSPMTCASNARGEGICYRCYGDLAYLNFDINIGIIASEMLSSKYTQRQLSAKHILEARIRKMLWNKNVEDLFQIDFNTLKLYEADVDYTSMQLVISDIQFEDEEDDLEFNSYVNSFSIVDKDGNTTTYNTMESDSIYLSEELNDLVQDIIKRTRSYDPDNDALYIPFDMLTDMDTVFLFDIGNDELNRVVTLAKKTLNNASEIKKYDKDSILKEFVNINMGGGISLNSVHYETIISNQIRDADDSLLIPDWSLDNVNYQILPLDKAIIENPCVTLSLQYQKIQKQSWSPVTYRKTKASSLDLFSMVNPQEYIKQPGLVEDKYVIKDVEDKKEDAVTFVSKKDKK